MKRPDGSSPSLAVTLVLMGIGFVLGVLHRELFQAVISLF